MSLSAKELKAQKKAEKAAKRAANKEASGITVSHSQSQNAPGVARDQRIQQEDSLALFNHLDKPKDITTASAPKNVHPAIIQLSLQFANYQIVGSHTRTRAMLLAFKEMIKTVSTPSDTTFKRNLEKLLSAQIEFIKMARPLSVAMGNAIRLLKVEISAIDIKLNDEAARKEANLAIDTIIRDKLDIADQAIASYALPDINDGDIIMTFAHSAVVERTLISAATNKESPKKFRVVIVDSRPLFEGKKMATALSSAGIQCSYVSISSVSYMMQHVNTVLLGAHAMLANGVLYSRVGTAMVCTCAKSRNIPVMVLCETLKFTERVQLDSVTFNELSSTDQLATSELKRLMKESNNLQLLSIMYDVSPMGAVKKVITELGSLPTSAVPVVVRDYLKGSAEILQPR